MMRNRRRAARNPGSPRRPGSTGLVVLALVLASAAARAEPVPFAPFQLIDDSRFDPFSLALGDIDGDGDLDLVVSALADTVEWFENTDGAGSFASAQVLTSNAQDPNVVLTADLDGDGDLDVAVASRLDDTIAWFENTDGAGSFGAKQVITTLTNGVNSLVAVDIDADGDLDLASASSAANEVAWHENVDGLATFAARTVVSTALSDPFGLVAADFDGDGDPDLAVTAVTGDEIAWFENTDGAGTFGGAQTITATPDAPTGLAAGDLDRDGDIDLVAAIQLDDRVAWYPNLDGLGSFGPLQILTLTAPAEGALTVAVADVDGDGDPDVLSASPVDSKLALYENDGTGSFAPQVVVSTATPGVGFVLAGDIDGDGDADLVASAFGQDQVAWYEAESLHRSARLELDQEVATGSLQVGALAAADLDGDAAPDLVSAAAGGDTVAWYRNADALGGFVLAQAVTTSAIGASDVAAGDLDGDGDLDLLTAAATAGTLDWHANTDGAGGFGAAQSISTGATAAAAVATADLDRDGDLDVLAAAGNEIVWHANTDAAGTFGAATPVTSAVLGASDVAVADLDRDGDLDVLSASTGDDTLAWYANDGSGGFAAQIVISTAALDPRSVGAADLDGDGDLDVFSVSEADDTLSWFPNTDGAGSFGTQQVVASSLGGARDGLARDLDGDGDLDLAVAAAADGRVVWFENLDGAATFGAGVLSNALLGGVSALAAADFDRDGRVDLASAASADDRVAWHPNGGGQFALPTDDLAPVTLRANTIAPLLEIDLAHRGRSGDPDLEWTTLELRLESLPGVPLTDAQALPLFDSIDLHLDDGSGVFEATDPILVSVSTFTLANGDFQIAFADADPDVTVSATASRRYFLSAALRPGAQLANPPHFRLVHRTSASSTAEDAEHDLPLALERQADTASRVVLAASVASDFDNDGVLDEDETDTGVFVSSGDTGTDPLDPDSDGDGAHDGAELLAGTDPNDPNDFPMAPPGVPALPWPMHLLGFAGALVVGGRAVAGRPLLRAAKTAGPCGLARRSPAGGERSVSEARRAAADGRAAQPSPG